MSNNNSDYLTMALGLARRIAEKAPPPSAIARYRVLDLLAYQPRVPFAIAGTHAAALHCMDEPLSLGKPPLDLRVAADRDAAARALSAALDHDDDLQGFRVRVVESRGINRGKSAGGEMVLTVHLGQPAPLTRDRPAKVHLTLRWEAVTSIQENSVGATILPLGIEVQSLVVPALRPQYLIAEVAETAVRLGVTRVEPVEMKSLRPLLRPPWSALLDMTAALQEVFSRRGTRLPPHLPPPPGFSVPEFHARRLWDVRGGALSSYDELRRVVDPVLVETVQDRQ